MNQKTKKLLIPWIVFQILLLVFFLISAFSQYRNRFQEHIFTPAGGVYYFTMGNYDSDQNAYCVDETSGTAGIFTCGPYMTMKKGIYDITVYYESTGDGHMAYVESEDSAFYANGVKGDQILLDSHHTSRSFRVQLCRDVEDFEIQTSYSGSGSLTVSAVSVAQGATDTIHTLFLRVLLLLGVNLFISAYFYWKTHEISREKILISAGLTGIILLSSLPLWKNGFPRYTTDLNFFLMRVDGLKDGLLSGTFPVRIQPNWLNGYGYATSIFYGDLFLYFPALLRMLGVSVQNAYFSYQFAINIATCLISYFCLKGIFSRKSIALLGSGLYTLSAYRLVLLYYTTRGGMFTAYTFLPLVLYGIYLIYKESKNYKSWLYTSLGMTFILHCHLLSAEMTALALLLFILLTATSFFKKGSLLSMLKAVGCSVILNLGFLIPLLDYMGAGFYVSSESWKSFYNYIQNDGINPSGFFNLFRDSNAYTTPDVVLICGLLFYFVLVLCIPKTNLSNETLKFRKMGNRFAALSCILCFMSTTYFPWDWIEETFEFLRMPINSIQYPHRFIEVAVLTLIVTICCGLRQIADSLDKNYYRYALSGISILLLIGSGWILSSVLNLDTYQPVYDKAYLDTNRISTKEYLPEGADPDLYTLEFPVAEDGIAIEQFDRRGLRLSIDCINVTNDTQIIEVPLVYYEDYQAADEDCGELQLTPDDNFSVLLSVPASHNGTITIRFQSPLSWTIAMWASGVWMLMLIGYFIKKQRSNTHSS